MPFKLADHCLSLWALGGARDTGLACRVPIWHHAPCITHHAPCTMHHAPRTISRCAKYHWHLTSCAGHRACTIHPLVCDVLDGTVCSIPSAMHHYPRSHRYTVLMWMSCTTSHHDGTIGMCANRVCDFISFTTLFAHFPLTNPGQRARAARPILIIIACLLKFGYPHTLLCITRLLMSGYRSVIRTPSLRI